MHGADDTVDDDLTERFPEGMVVDDDDRSGMSVGSI